MSPRFLMTLVAGLAFCASPAFAADTVAAQKPDATEALLDLLFKQEVMLGDHPNDNVNINDIPLLELLSGLSTRYKLTFTINEDCFKAAGVNDIAEAKPKVASTRLRGMKMHELLTVTLESMRATYIIKGNRIEIVTPEYAAKMAKTTTTQNADGKESLAEPLVSAIIKEKPLNEAVAMIAERYDLTVVVSPQSGDARTGFVTARLLNVPADKALELLALQADLRVVRKGNAFLITSRDHANDMFGEKLERERQLIELKKFRDAPLPKPEPKVEPKPEPKGDPGK
jgi:hypothetical protein